MDLKTNPDLDYKFNLNWALKWWRYYYVICSKRFQFICQIISLNNRRVEFPNAIYSLRSSDQIADGVLQQIKNEFKIKSLNLEIQFITMTDNATKNKKRMDYYIGFQNNKLLLA
jgi:hypothetical protein